MGFRATLPLLAAIAILASAGPGLGQIPTKAQIPTKTDSTRISLQFQDAEIAKVVEAVAVAMGERFLFDDTLRGRITIAVSERVSAPEALEILNAALLMKGYAAVPSPGGFRKIIPIQNTATHAPWTLERPLREREGVVTTMVRVRYAEAGRILDALQPMLATSVLGRVYAPTNSLILAGTEARLRRILIVVQALDQAQRQHLRVLRLRYRGATEVSRLIESVFDAEASQGLFTLVVDERTNALIVEGAPHQLDKIRAFVREMDTPIEGGGELHVVRALNVDAERLAELIRGASSGATRSPGRPGASTPPDYTIAVDAPTNSLVIRAAPHTFRDMADLIRELDQAPAIVSLEVLVVEVSTSQALKLGVGAIVPLGNDVGAEGETEGTGLVQINRSAAEALADPTADTVFRLSRSPLVIPVDLPGGETIAVEVPVDNVVILARDLQISTRILLNPHLIAISGEEQQIQVGDNIPIPVSRVTTDETSRPLTQQQDIERHDVGTYLRVLPTVGVKGGVHLVVHVETSQIAPSQVGTVEQVGPTIRQRTIDATFTLRDGELAVIGTLDQPRRVRVERAVPFLGRIPILGRLFRTVDDQDLNSHLVIAIQARVLRTPTDHAAESIRRRLAFERHLQGLEGLSRVTEAPYALLATTRSRRGDADAIAGRLSGPEGNGRVVVLETDGRPRFDVYLTGFQKLAEAGKAALDLSAQGWTPSVVAVPRSLH